MKQFVYSFLLVVAALFGAPTALFAQCTPLDTIPGDEIIDPLPFTEDNPGSGIRDTACVGQDFVTVFNIEVPESVDIPPFGTLSIDSIIVEPMGVIGLPDGLDVSFNPENRLFLPNTTGCIQIAGVPATGTEGEYELTIMIRIRSGIANLPFTLPDGNVVEGVYNLVVRENGNPSCQPSSITEASNESIALEVYPNPANESLKARFAVRENISVNLTLIDAFGRRVKQLPMEATNGQNEARIEVSDLPVGFYTLLITDRDDPRKGVSQRVMINR